MMMFFRGPNRVVLKFGWPHTIKCKLTILCCMLV